MPASFADFRAMSKSGNKISPSAPIIFTPKYMEISVASGDKPICAPMTFGSIVRRKISKMTPRIDSLVASTVSPVTKWKMAQGAIMTIEPIIGIKSITQIIKAVNNATFGVINNNPTNETAKIIKLTRNCAFQKPNTTYDRRDNIKCTFSFVSSVKCEKIASRIFGKSCINKNKVIKYTRKLIKNVGTFATSALTL